MGYRRWMVILAVVIVALTAAWQKGIVPWSYLAKNEVDTKEQILRSIRSADEIQDPYRRCITYPNPRNVQWSAEVIEAFCNDAFAIYPTSKQVYRWIINGDNLKAEDRFNNIIDSYFLGSVPEGALRYSYYSNFSSSAEEVNRITSKWLSLSPQNAHALTARGLHLLKVGIEARGEKTISKTSLKNRQRLRIHLLGARKHLEKAIQLDNRIMPAYAGLITIGQYLGDRKLADTYYQKGISIDQKNYHLRYAFIQLLRPRWGGSHDQMDAFVENSELFLKDNPRLSKLRSIALGSRGWHMYFRGGEVNHQVAMNWFEKALESSPLISLMDTAAYTAVTDLDDRLRAIELYSQILRFGPSNVEVLRSRVYSLTRLDQLEWALVECQRILALEPNDPRTLRDYAWLLEKSGDKQAAYTKLLQLHSLDSNDEWVALKLAKSYLYDQRRFELAKPLVDQLLEVDPKNGSAWLLRVDLLQNTGGSNLREAVEQFVHYADSNNREQRLALEKAKSWLERN